MTARVLVTRPRGTWPALAARFSGTSIVLQWTPTTTHVDPADPGPGDAALAAGDRWDWLVVTSPRGVAALSRRLAPGAWPKRFSGARVAAVGPATAAALETIGLSADVVAEDAGSSGLAAALGPRLAPGARVLLVRPEGPVGPLGAGLRAFGAEVREAPLYRTVPSAEAEALAGAAISGAFAGVVFTAPSALTLWLAAAGPRRPALEAALGSVRRVAIGATTAASLLAAGLPADAIAAAPSELAVGDAIARALSRSTC